MNRFPHLRLALFAIFLAIVPAHIQAQENESPLLERQDVRVLELERQVKLERQALWQILLPFSLLLWGGIAGYLWFLHSKQRKILRDIETLREELVEKAKKER